MGLGLGISVDWASLVPYYAQVASAFKARVEADGGTVESMSCLKKDLKVLNPVKPPAVDADYQAILDRSTALGYTAPSAAQQTLQNTLVEDLKTAGVWDKLDVFYVFATDGDGDYATLNWKAPSSHQVTKVSSPTFTANVGFTGDASSAYLDTNYNPTNDAINYALNAASFGFFISDEGTYTTTSLSDFGSPDSVNRAWYRRTTNRFYINSSGYTVVTAYTANTFVHANRNGSNTAQVYHDGTLVDSPTNAASGIPPLNFTAFKRLGVFAESTLGIAFVGGDLSSESSDFHDAINTYMTAL